MLEVFLLRSPYTIDRMLPAFLVKYSGAIIIDDDIIRGKVDKESIRDYSMVNLSPDERFFYLLNHEIYHASRSSKYNKVCSPLYNFGQKYGRKMMLPILILSGCLYLVFMLDAMVFSFDKWMSLVIRTIITVVIAMLVPILVYCIEEILATRHGMKNKDHIEMASWKKALVNYDKNVNTIHLCSLIIKWRNQCRSCNKKEKCWKKYHHGDIPPYFAGCSRTNDANAL